MDNDQNDLGGDERPRRSLEPSPVEGDSASHVGTGESLTDWRVNRLEALSARYRIESQTDALGSFQQSESLAYAESLDAAIDAIRRDCDWAIIAALANSGIDTACGACMEVAFTGVTTNAHTCADTRGESAFRAGFEMAREGGGYGTSDGQFEYDYTDADSALRMWRQKVGSGTDSSHAKRADERAGALAPKL